MKFEDIRETKQFVLKKQSWITQQDMFGYHPGLNVDGNETHNTAIGGCCSIFVKVLIWFYVFLNFKKMVRIEGDTIITENHYIDMADLEVTLNET